MHIYVVRMHALIHMFCVLHNKTFSKTPTILLKGIQKFDDEITRKIALSHPNWLEFEHCKVFGVHKVGKGSKITSPTWKIRKPQEWKSWKVDAKRCKRRLPK